MLDFLMQYSDAGLSILRVTLGVIFIYHGVKKWKMKGLNGPMGIIVSVLKFVEPIVGALLILGIYSDWMALIFGIVMVGAIMAKIVMMKTPFSSMKATGWEYDLVLLVSTIVLLTNGAGSSPF